MAEKYSRRADYNDMPLEIRLGILQFEYEIAETEDEKSKAQAAIAHLKEAIAKFVVKPAPVFATEAERWKWIGDR